MRVSKWKLPLAYARGSSIDSFLLHLRLSHALPAKPPSFCRKCDAAGTDRRARTAGLSFEDYRRRFYASKRNAAGSTSTAIYIRNTRFARRAGSILTSEEWRIKALNGKLILVGGGTRGTLYATYHLLEDVAGVRWWNPWEEAVPARGVLTVPQLDKRGKPACLPR